MMILALWQLFAVAVRVENLFHSQELYTQRLGRSRQEDEQTSRHPTSQPRHASPYKKKYDHHIGKEGVDQTCSKSIMPGYPTNNKQKTRDDGVKKGVVDKFNIWG